MNINDFIIGYICSNPGCKGLSAEDHSACPICNSKGLKPVYDYYSLFNLNSNFTTDQLSKAYKKLSLKYHPDINPDGKNIFLILSEGYQVLNETHSKNDYLYIYNKIKSGNFENENFNKYGRNHYFYEQQYSEADFEEFFRSFHNFGNQSYDLGRASSAAGIIGGILGGIAGFFIIPGLGAFIGFFLGSFLGRTNPALGPIFLRILNFIIIFGGLTLFFTVGRLMPLPFLLLWGLIMIVYFNYKREWNRIFSSK